MQVIRLPGIHHDANSVLNITCVIKDYGATQPLSEEAQELVNGLISFIAMDMIRKGKYYW